ncbi:hypothetical protein [Candidatus Electronema sp. TJ]|uniref:hypothetical protein n=1 Tax=Candidatus Electronema sp. TJ TaxID=3401573 RepID=UPI003AA848FD
MAISSHHHETQGRIVRRFPNWRSTYGIFMIAGGSGGALPEREGRPLPPFSS